jgi:enolase
MEIFNIHAIEILDSRGNPTLEVKVILNDGSTGVFKVPSGASTGIHEALELRDDDKKRYLGKGVLKAIENINTVKKELIDKNFTQKELDETLIKIDGSENKSVLGANAILGISCAFARAQSNFYGIPLYEYLYRILNDINLKNKKIVSLKENSGPILFSNVINGGLHAGNDLNIQEFMILVLEGEIKERIRKTSEIYHHLKEIIAKKYGKSQVAVGDEGGFAPNLSKTKEALDLLMEAIKAAGYEGEVALAIDAAASDFYDKKTNKYEVEKGLLLDYKELSEYYNDLIKNYPIISIEDPFAEDDFEAFSYYMKKVLKLKSKNPLSGKNNVIIVGDDLLVTNPERIKKAQNEKMCNSLLLKINQIGSLTEALEAYKLAKKNNWHVVVSHRSGETCDSFIADLATALKSSIKLGSPARGERVAKYNRLLEIFK